MCGIAGRVNFKSGSPVDPATVAAMCTLLQHRGPDGQGVHCAGAIGFGHRRLAIIDLSPLGRQPMHSLDGGLTITFNGEIYNYRELRARLEGRQHRFASHSDTEVILAAYREYGDACVEHFTGMFAFAIWDEPRRRLLLARDRVGKKPLFYRLDDDGLIFASEPKAFLADPSFHPSVDEQAISQYLSFQYVPAPRSAFAGVTKLLPGHVLTVEDGRLSTSRYWRLSYAGKTSMSEGEALAAVDAHLDTAVRRRMVSDVPVGAFLSGGIDSGLVVSYMAQAQAAPVHTFSIGFNRKDHDELPAARLVAARYQTNHREFVVEPDAISLLPQLVWHHSEPFADSSSLPTFVLSALTRQHVTVALNGDGGDESFAGYDRYYASMLTARAQLAPARLRQLLAFGGRYLSQRNGNRALQRAARLTSRLAGSTAQQYAVWMMHFLPDAKRALCSPEFLSRTTDDSLAMLEAAFASSDATNVVDQVMDVDVRTYLPDDLLVKADIATMAHGVEGRSPFLDHELMAFAAALPRDLKLRGREKKYLLRRLAASRLPPELLSLPKKGFGVPIEHWFRHELRDFTRDVLLDGRLGGRGYFDMSVVKRLIDDHIDGRGRWQYQLWNLVMLELWHRMFIDQRPVAPPQRIDSLVRESTIA